MKFFNDFVCSLWNMNFYAGLTDKKFSYAVKYIFLLPLILTVLFILLKFPGFYHEMTLMKSAFQTKVPEFNLKDGRLTVNSDHPIYLEKEKNSIFVVDTTGKTTVHILDSYQTGFLVTANEIIQKNQGQTKTTYFKDFKELSFTKKDLLKWFNLMYIFGILFIVLYYLLGVIGMFWSALVASVIGLLLKWIMKAKVEFSQIYLLSVFVVTLPKLLNITFSLPFWVFYGIVLIYQILVYRKIRQIKDHTA
ncbi:hypothetical protein AN960_16665 [Bacillus sp. FJAT-25509]|uniref:DUF1189 domain-containing protein n=1 Tax=Bacillus sp. FJAT-25509 TaxID=1712029 RepID=UPI0006FAE94C|nr:DUF1189 domain-containing protein [Bacillus sp. FJAT-25509]KQL36252.1 hypothetical protein AN960_16665 [Bacillus sp. FJAT-25509]